MPRQRRHNLKDSVTDINLAAVHGTDKLAKTMLPSGRLAFGSLISTACTARFPGGSRQAHRDRERPQNPRDRRTR
jgi:hypothetical protein